MSISLISLLILLDLSRGAGSSGPSLWFVIVADIFLIVTWAWHLSVSGPCVLSVLQVFFDSGCFAFQVSHNCFLFSLFDTASFITPSCQGLSPIFLIASSFSEMFVMIAATVFGFVWIGGWVYNIIIMICISSVKVGRCDVSG